MYIVKILNCNILNIKLDTLLRELEEGVIVTPNVDHLIMLQKDKEFYDLYQEANYILCDSKIIQIASKFLTTPIVEKISGSDFFPAFYNYHKNNNDIKIFLLGAMDGVAEKAAENINNNVGRNIIIGVFSPSYGFENNDDENRKIIQIINDSGATVLAIGVGSPKGEKWINKYKNKIPSIKIFMSIGATIDFEAGQVQRSPKWMSNLGIEWLYRLILEPKRLWRRYLIDDLPFFWLIIQDKLGLYKNPFKK